MQNEQARPANQIFEGDADLQPLAKRALNLAGGSKKEQEAEFWKQLAVQLEIHKTRLNQEDCTLDQRYRAFNSLFQSMIEMMQAFRRTVRLDENIFLQHIQCENAELLQPAVPEEQASASKTTAANDLKSSLAEEAKEAKSQDPKTLLVDMG